MSCFEASFKTTPEIVVRAPGRINLLGEHTDYNEGFVLPAAIDKAVWFIFSRNNTGNVKIVSSDLNEEVELPINELQKSESSWANFLLGVIHVLQQKGFKFNSGFDVCFGGNIPLGAGLSSSAAIESGMCMGINELFNLNISRKDMALIAQKAEHEFAGVNCGIMDMYASIFGKENHLIKLDCKNISHEYLPFDFENYKIVLFNTGVKHNLGDSAYNTRRSQCEHGLALLSNYYDGLSSLRDVNLSMLESKEQEFDPEVFKRCKYVVNEAERMTLATLALENKDLVSFGALMYETHNGLKNEYEVSCPELDFLVDLVKKESGVLGARMMGGGFGGCTINIIEKSKIKEIRQRVSEKYELAYGFIPEIYEVLISEGCTVEKA